jgi:hypothetical protein
LTTAVDRREDLSFLASYSRKWIDNQLNKEYSGARFFWNKRRAEEFARTPIETLLFDKYFLDAKRWMYPGVAETILDIYEQRKHRNIRVVCILGGFGTGKSGGIGAALNWLQWFEFSCKFDPTSERACPQEFYGLKPTSIVAFIALSKTRDKSEKITFSEMKPAFESQFNKDYFPINPNVKSVVEITANNTLVFPNTATEAANAGWSVYSFVMDEISFLELIDNSSRNRGSTRDVYDQAQEAYASADGRRFSRFKRDGMGILLSSLNYSEDFLMTKIRNAYNGDISESETYFKVFLPWKVNPEKFGGKKYFYFDTNKFEIIKNDKEVAALDKYYIEVPIEKVIFGENSDDPNDELLRKVRSGQLKV